MEKETMSKTVNLLIQNSIENELEKVFLSNYVSFIKYSKTFFCLFSKNNLKNELKSANFQFEIEMKNANLDFDEKTKKLRDENVNYTQIRVLNVLIFLIYFDLSGKVQVFA